MKRFASTRSDQRARQPELGRAQCSVGSIDDDGIRYGLTTHALIASTIAIAPTIVTIQSMIPRHGCGTPRRASGFSPGGGGGGSGGSAGSAGSGLYGQEVSAARVLFLRRRRCLGRLRVVSRRVLRLVGPPGVRVEEAAHCTVLARL